MKRVVHAACPHDCPDACGVLINVEDGRATKIQGDPAHPITRGFLCAKVAKYLDRVYSPDRVLYPLRRVVPKGPCGAGTPVREAFQRITWDEALAEITDRFKRIAAEFGSEAILPYSYGGTLGTLNGSSMDRRFFHRLGASQLERTICSVAGEEGLKSVIGVKWGTEPEQFAHSRYIIAWAANIHGNNVHLWPFIEEARRKGAKLVVIDPYRTRTAACADWYLPLNPGTDAALALAMMHVIINEGLYDADYVSRYTLGFERLRQKVQEYPPQRVAQWTGISIADTVKLAREYATTRPAVIRVNYGVQRSERGGMAMRAITMLPCITGSWKEVGGGLQLSTSGAFGLNRQALDRPDLMVKALGRPARVVNMVELGKALNTLQHPPIKALFVYNSNPAAVCPNQNEVTRGLRRPDLFTAVHEQFLTDTTDYADIVLPATTFFEHKELQTAYGHYYVQMSHPAIEPLGECRSNVELFRGLAERMGFEEECFRESVDQMMDAALASENPWLSGIDRQRLEREGHVRLNFEDQLPKKSFPLPVPRSQPGFFLPFAEGNFPTASGKAELYSQSLKAQGLDPVAEFTPPSESRHGEKAKEFPLELLARKADNFLNSSFSNVPAVQEMEEVGLLEINRVDAVKRGITDGDTVRVFNGRGHILLKARVNGAVPPGVVSARLYWAKLAAEGRNANVLTSEKLTDLGNSATFYSVLVEVELSRPAS
ncbi:MAG TPA: molybdopterin-dependent oxidoreductase [Terriglobales bacterium]|jgi:anaerobic selenocysteine-containing dehydrogenase|nr:molybdopterin-dependent oxidoreductase [Terriglobales bacterium]